MCQPSTKYQDKYILYIRVADIKQCFVSKHDIQQIISWNAAGQDEMSTLKAGIFIVNLYAESKYEANYFQSMTLRL